MLDTSSVLISLIFLVTFPCCFLTTSFFPLYYAFLLYFESCLHAVRVLCVCVRVCVCVCVCVKDRGRRRERETAIRESMNEKGWVCKVFVVWGCCCVDPFTNILVWWGGTERNHMLQQLIFFSLCSYPVGKRWNCRTSFIYESCFDLNVHYWLCSCSEGENDGIISFISVIDFNLAMFYYIVDSILP